MKQCWPSFSVGSNDLVTLCINIIRCCYNIKWFRPMTCHSNMCIELTNNNIPTTKKCNKLFMCHLLGLNKGKYIQYINLIGKDWQMWCVSLMVILLVYWAWDPRIESPNNALFLHLFLFLSLLQRSQKLCLNFEIPALYLPKKIKIPALSFIPTLSTLFQRLLVSLLDWSQKLKSIFVIPTFQ